MHVRIPRESRPVTYVEFKQRVRAFPRSSLLRALGIESARLEQERRASERPRRATSWSFAVAGIARTCLVSGNEYRSRPVTVDDVARLCHDFLNVDDPDVGSDGEAGIGQILTKIIYEQAATQWSPMENLGRSIALFLDSATAVDNAPTTDESTEILGVSLDQFMRVGFATYVAAVQNHGSINRALLSTASVAPIFAPIVSEAALTVMDRYFIATPAQHAQWTRDREVKGREKWSPNPLQNRPIVTIGDDLVVPAAHYLIERISPHRSVLHRLGAMGTPVH